MGSHTSIHHGTIAVQVVGPGDLAVGRQGKDIFVKNRAINRMLRLDPAGNAYSNFNNVRRKGSPIFSFRSLHSLVTLARHTGHGMLQMCGM